MSSSAPSWFKKGDRVQSLKRSLLTLGAEYCKLNSRLDAAERDNGHLRADLRKDAGEFDRMRDSMRGLLASCTILRGKYDQLKQREARLRGVLNVLTNGNLGPLCFCTSVGSLKTAFRGTAGGKSARGWTLLTRSGCRAR